MLLMEGVFKEMSINSKFGIVVVGGGHAGCEAALAVARMGVSARLVTLDPKKIAEMSCNPSIGGVGKGQLVKEVDALGGEMGKVADLTAIHFKRLNTRKGSAVQSSRCQSDKKKYARAMQGVLKEQPNLEVLHGEVKAILVSGGRVCGVKIGFQDGGEEVIEAQGVVITAGTFMAAVMHCGEMLTEGGRYGEKSSVGLSSQLEGLGLRRLRLKTGTPARFFRDSIDFSKLAIQLPDSKPKRFSFSDTKIELPQVPCYLGYTNEGTHEVIRNNLHRSPLYSGRIKGIGPRYCPSIEDKVVKFPDKNRHQIFFEPEALDSDWIYPNGLSTSLPGDVQEDFVKTLPGCEKVEFARYGYAIEYDCFDPRDLTPTLESKRIEGLFLAGQVNGTSGYEEAACQGLVAGMNAALGYQGKGAITFARSESYIGVLIDDLITLGVAEPYRMFTSRAEFRLSLREDNADLRLSDYGRKVGLIDDEQWQRFEKRRNSLRKCHKFLKTTLLRPSAEIQSQFEKCNTSPLTSPQLLLQLLKRPEFGIYDLLNMSGSKVPIELDEDTRETLEIETKYEGYISIQQQEIRRLKKMEGMSIPEGFDFEKVIGLSMELREKLGIAKPNTLAQAAKISGVTPAALAALLYSLRKKGKDAVSYKI